MKDYLFIVPRPWEAGTAAIVRFKSRLPDLDAEGARNQITAAITQWVKQTKAGQAAWEMSSEDYNIGDLACELIDDELKAQFVAHDILDLNIETLSVDAMGWEFDNRLVDEDSL